MISDVPVMKVSCIGKSFRDVQALHNVSLDVFCGEVVAVVGESGSGKSTLLHAMAGQIDCDTGQVVYFNSRRQPQVICTSNEIELLPVMRKEWGFITQDPKINIRMHVSAGGNIAERLILAGERNYLTLREKALYWLSQVGLESSLIDKHPRNFSSGMLQRLQIAKCLSINPRLIFMDEPTGGLDAPLQAKILDLIHSLVNIFGLTVVIVTHDMAVARLLADRIVVVFRGNVIETGLADRILEDPREEYTQLLVSSTAY